jgi:hypothetical protein
MLAILLPVSFVSCNCRVRVGVQNIAFYFPIVKHLRTPLIAALLVDVSASRKLGW